MSSVRSRHPALDPAISGTRRQGCDREHWVHESGAPTRRSTWEEPVNLLYVLLVILAIVLIVYFLRRA